MMNISASGTDDDLVIAIPDETVQVGNDDTVSVETPETKDAPPKRERGEGGRFSSKSEKTDDERAKIQRERDEFARVNADIQARLADAEARATAAAEARGKAEETALLRENQAIRAHWARLHSDKSQIDSAISATQIEADATYEIGADDGKLVDYVIGDIGKLKEPYIAIVHLSNTHFPYKIDPEDMPFTPQEEATGPGWENEILNRYQDSMVNWDIHFTAWHQGVTKPVICAVNGLCAGGGFHFVADADIVIAASDAQFFDPHVSVGDRKSVV